MCFSDDGDPKFIGEAHAFGDSDLISARDLDRDGDLDIVMSSFAGIFWYENEEEKGMFAEARRIQTHQGGTPTIAIDDVDGDGDLDVLSGSYSGFAGPHKLTWYENRPIGDSNDDGIFSSGDLVVAFQAGEYEDKLQRNSTFDEGDWNADGDFDSGDLVFVFQSRSYVDNSIFDAIAAALGQLFTSESPDMNNHSLGSSCEGDQMNEDHAVRQDGIALFR